MKTSIHSTDNELVSAFQQSDNKALEILISRHKDKIFTSIVVLVKDKFLAEDLFQEAFIKIINTLRNDGYNEEGKFLPWAIRIAHNLCLDHFRRIKTKPPIVTSEGYDIFEGINVVDNSSDHGMIKGQSHDRIRKMVDRLPAEQREVIVLRHYADLSFKEIAEKTNCCVNTALGRMRYALLNLRKMMEEKQMAL